MTCANCDARAERPLCGAFHFGCVHCCAALVRSTHPDKKQARAMLAAIGRFDGAPSRQAILNCVGEGLAAAAPAALVAAPAVASVADAPGLERLGLEPAGVVGGAASGVGVLEAARRRLGLERAGVVGRVSGALL